MKRQKMTGKLLIISVLFNYISCKQRVAILGGGISGLTTAAYLSNSTNDYDVHLFEASDRLGGRIMTKNIEGLHLEQGGVFINEEHINVKNLASMIGHEMVTGTAWTDSFGYAWDTPNNEVTKCLRRRIKQQNRHLRNGQFEKIVLLSKALYKCKASKTLRKIISGVVQSELGCDVDETTLLSASETIKVTKTGKLKPWGRLGYDNHSYFKDGSNGFILSLLSYISRQSSNFEYQLNETVKEINLKEDGLDVLIASKTLNEEKLEDFDFVVSTIPVSMYKNLQITGLKNDETDLLNSFTTNNQLGRNRKVFFLFSRPWWSDLTSGHFDYCVEKASSCFWTSPVHQNSANINATTYSLTFFTGGTDTDKIDKTVKKAKKQLFKQFGKQIDGSYIKNRVSKEQKH